MNVQTVFCIDALKSEMLVHKTVIVIDVFRASSSIVTAFSRGAASIIPAETVAEARQFGKAGYLIGGERYGKHLEGFHFGNAPSDFSSSRIKGRDIVLTTTNGTRALVKASRASDVLIGCFLNAKACADKAKALHHDILLLCAGTRGEFALEDGIAAGCILHHLKEEDPTLPCDDEGLALLHAYRSINGQLSDLLSLGRSGQRLKARGRQGDIYDCIQINRYSIVPTWHQDRFVP
ncbi:2-phosphosulfolactate phosphatase [Desmospora profundinema]|uniref:Probable 2-phosphosulfolactate phosphatase n=1 Tax=Desmospora profundinema TaxID=1571184 RepID=A0ABU1IIT0_9BACL|nr:2-phosphosulfolactate phosphatase [Desmospora profundinema]MDR6224666.1 2-phosphosulfolactate phosphatase [Desmospora profundinema]